MVEYIFPFQRQDRLRVAVVCVCVFVLMGSSLLSGFKMLIQRHAAEWSTKTSQGIKESVQHSGKICFSLSCKQQDEKIDTSLVFVFYINSKLLNNLL